MTSTRTPTQPAPRDHELAITKLASSDLVMPGDLLTFTLIYTVTGNEPAPNVVITDEVPAYTTYVSGGDEYVDGIVRWHLGTLTPPYSGSVQFVVRVNANAPHGAHIVNTAYIFDDDGKRDQSTKVVRVTHNPEDIPEAGTWILLGSGLASAAAYWRLLRRRRKG